MTFANEMKQLERKLFDVRKERFRSKSYMKMPAKSCLIIGEESIWT